MWLLRLYLYLSAFYGVFYFYKAHIRNFNFKEVNLNVENGTKVTTNSCIKIKIWKNL